MNPIGPIEQGRLRRSANLKLAQNQMTVAQETLDIEKYLARNRVKRTVCD